MSREGRPLSRGWHLAPRARRRLAAVLGRKAPRAPCYEDERRLHIHEPLTTYQPTQATTAAQSTVHSSRARYSWPLLASKAFFSFGRAKACSKPCTPLLLQAPSCYCWLVPRLCLHLHTALKQPTDSPTAFTNSGHYY